MDTAREQVAVAARRGKIQLQSPIWRDQSPIWRAILKVTERVPHLSFLHLHMSQAHLEGLRVSRYR